MSNNPEISNSGHPEPLWIGDMFQNHTAFLKKLFWISKQNMPCCNVLSLPLVASSVTTIFSLITFAGNVSYWITIIQVQLPQTLHGMCYSPLSNSLSLCQLLSASFPNPLFWKWRPNGRHYCIWVFPAGRAEPRNMSFHSHSLSITE